MKANFRAVIFDLDGVIIQSEDLHARAKRKTLEHYRIAYPESIFKDFKGRPDITFWQHVAENLNGNKISSQELDGFKRSEFFKLAVEMELVPGVLDFITNIRSRFPYLALVSSATMPDLEVSDKKFGIIKWFDVVHLGEDTIHPKPDPEPYLKALKKMNIQATEALVIEDSPNGVISAVTAGCNVIGITTGFTQAELLKAGCSVVAADYEQIMKIVDGMHP